MPKAHHVLRALKRAGWIVVRQRGSHRRLRGPSGKMFTFAFHDRVDIGSVALKKIAEEAEMSVEELRKLM